MEILRPVPEENLEIQSPKIFSDKIYLECLRLAIQSKAEDERYGSVLIKNGKIFGRGYNRAISHPSFRLDRIIRQGYANHAEIEAMNSALSKKHNIKGTSIYVAGYFPKENGLLFLHEEFTCPKCAVIMQKYDIDTLFVPSAMGWVGRNVKDIEAETRRYNHNANNNVHQNRINSIKEDWKISNLQLAPTI
jgi:tRNA(Arg) A34 adenosine deaminase TadA